VFTAGSALPETLSQRVRARVCSNLTTGYGSTEATMIASMPAHYTERTPGAAGIVLPGMLVEATDSNGLALPPGVEGLVRIRTDYGVDGYLDDPAETGRVFRDGWFYPGDLGYVTKDNILVLTGRASNVLNLGGEKMNPERIESILSTHPSVVESGVLAFSTQSGVDELCALVVPRSYLNAKVLGDFCRDSLPAAFVPTRFIAVAELPKNAMGKVERAKLPDLLRAKLN